MKESRADRRRSKRKDYNALFEYALHGEQIKTFRPGVTVDMNESGVGIITDCDLEPGQVIIFKSKENPSAIKIAIVRWSMKTGDKCRAGIIFI